MLEVIKVKKRSDIIPFFSQFDARKESWLVSDLRTKLELQNRLIQRDSFFIDSSVLRVTDLWRTLYRREFPLKRPVDSEWVRILTSNFLKKNINSLKLNQASATTILEMIEFFLPILSHPEGHDRFKDWMETHNDIRDRWSEWYVLARLCFKYLYEELNLVLPSWFSSLLVQNNSVFATWTRPLWVDLGGQILWSEAENLRFLSRQTEVKVFCLENEWTQEFSYKLRPYQHLLDDMPRMRLAPMTEVPTAKKISTLKFSGELAEIREAVAQSRIWLDQGIPAQEIGIIAPDIEKYWPVLKCFLDQEGIATNKDTMTRLSSWPSIQEWMSLLRLRLKEVRSSDLETHYFRQASPQMNYEEFRALYANILDSEDLGQDQHLMETYSSPLQISGRPTKEEWIVFICRLWTATQDTQPLARLLKPLYMQGANETSLPLSDWFSHLESLVGRIEVVVDPADPKGIHLASLMSAPALWLRKRIFLGLTEDNLKQSGSQFLSRFEVEKLFSDLGFFLENHEISSKDFELRTLAESDNEEDVYSYGAVTLSGQLQAPSGFWLQLKSPGELRAPRITRWDEIQRSNLSETLQRQPALNNFEPEKAILRIQMDQDILPFSPFTSAVNPSLSASRVETFLNCGFKFACETFFQLKELPEVDLHVDPRHYGNFIHDLFEALTFEPGKWDFSNTELGELVEKIYLESYQKFFHAKLWPAYKVRLVGTANRFVQFERTWRERFPLTQTIAREKKWSYQIASTGGTLSLGKSNQATGNGFYIAGTIDRVDSDGQGHLVVLDYKSGSTSAENFSQWFEKNKLQLLFYIWALENDSANHEEVVGAFYFVFKNMERHRGLAVKDGGSQLYSVDGRAGSLTDAETKKKLVLDLEKTLIEVMDKITGGQFQPRPRDEAICENCHWRSLCRAPHLR